MEVLIMKNHLKNQTSPYLLQHAENPVHWYPWCEEAFQQARKEDKPVFLSIGYSTCHWCHVMAHESFEDEEIAEILNEKFISIKVDKEERPDIDSIYMSVCQALTGSGGWPTTIFMTPEQKPFFAGTYFPKTSRMGMVGFQKLIISIAETWEKERNRLLESSDEIVTFIKKNNRTGNWKKRTEDSTQLLEYAVGIYKRSFDKEYGGFGDAPKFPAPHNLLFLMNYYERTKEPAVMEMVDKTLTQMYHGGIFDHIGGGFSRYSTDKFFLAPHFEKMLYDNALLIMAYCKACELTRNVLYQEVAERTATYVLKELTSPEGGFYCAQDADSEGIEGKYYLFEPWEIIEILGKEKGEVFCRYFDITEDGNFEGKNILNLLKNQNTDERSAQHSLKDQNFEKSTNQNPEEKNIQRLLKQGVDENNRENLYTQKNDIQKSDFIKLYEYRKQRYHLHLDDKILTSWNGLMIAAMCHLYRITENELYLETAEKAQKFIEDNLCEDDTLFVSWREGKSSGKGFLDDYANEIFALLALYEATLEQKYLEKAQVFCGKAVSSFYDENMGGFFLNSSENETLILQPKEIYDGAVPSGNSMMAYNLVRLSYYLNEEKYKAYAKKQISFMEQEADRYPAGYAMFLTALFDFVLMPEKIVIVLKEKKDIQKISCKIPLGALIRVLENPTVEYPRKDEKTTYYVCKGTVCMPAVNNLEEVIE